MAERRVFCNGNDQCCEDCKAQCNKNFKKVLELKKSGLVIYVHQRNDKENVPTKEKYVSVILLNTTDKYFKRPTFMSEFGQHKVKCFRCTTLIQRVRNLLTEIKCIKGNETIGVCDYCKRSNVSNCKRCEYVVSKFISQKNNSEKFILQLYKEWVNKVTTFLQSLLEGTIFEHNVNQGTASFEELKRLLNELKSPLFIRQPDIEMFPFLEELKSFDNLTESKELLDKLLLKFNRMNDIYPNLSMQRSSIPVIGTNSKEDNIQYKSSYDDLSFRNSQDLIKYVKNFGKGKENKLSENTYKTDKDGDNLDIDTNILTLENRIDKLVKNRNVISVDRNDRRSVKKMTKGHDNVLEDISNQDTKKNKMLKEKGKNIEGVGNNIMSEKTKSSLKKIKKDHDEDSYIIDKNQKRKDLKGDKFEKRGKRNAGLNDRMLMKIMKRELLKNNKMNKEKRNDNKTLPVKNLQPMLDLPVLQFRELVEISSASVVECADTRVIPNVMIQGQNVVPLQHIKYENDATVPLLYHIKKDISSHSYQNPPIAKTIEISSTLPAITTDKKNYAPVVTNDKGVLRYQLSDPECITKGWTSLPSLKIKRRVNVYKMNPVSPGKNWFERNKSKTICYEDCEDRFAEIDDEGFGKLFYKNGRVALDYYKAKEPYAGHRYIIYSDGEPKNGVSRPVTVLGVFDGIGNGVIYDNYGSERLKYNQSEGMLIDKKVDSPCKWKWHTLNDPPVFQPVFVNTFCKKTNTFFENTDESAKSETESENAKSKNGDMLTIELENFLKEKADKLLQKFKPFEIKSKAVKINNQFSLRIFQQSDINLMYREGRTSVKINLGLRLVSNEIVNTETVEVPQVCTSYDRFPPRSESIENIQRILRSARNLKTKLMH